MRSPRLINSQAKKDEIVALTAGILKLEILDEKWNGEKYSLTAKIEAIEALNNVIQNNPTHLVYYERGMAHIETGRYDDGLASS